MNAAGKTGAGDLVGNLDIRHELNAALGPLTWYGVGGAAEVLAHPGDAHQLSALLRACHESAVPIHVLGRGANLLVADSGVRGVVVQLNAKPFGAIRFEGDDVIAGGGADLAKVIMSCVRRGLAGLEGLAGVPASVGGALRMNAGGHHATISGALVGLVSMDATGRTRELARQDVGFEYRSSDLTDPIIVEARFALSADDPALLRKRVKSIFRDKKASQPLQESSAGCAFKNPPAAVSDRPAGRLIDEAGLKGFRIGGAEVSTQHANFVVVHSDGTADDVLHVMAHVQRAVRERFGVDLEREVVVWGQS
ncbi:MAG: UDP-N-acetylenolpyruvoylglucosamine reductase [Planctomycetaceae bacterium]|nr:UDP-N-acetylenolpyruvoylglucosamine reductase [Planctomycetaceae bacterium]